MNENLSAPAPAAKTSTTAGNYFISNYPPFSFWSEDQKVEVELALNSEPTPGAKLGLYHHIPFCRKRCHFCYFRVYTDKNADEIKGYIDAGMTEYERYAATPRMAGRKPKFVYFGGGTPSYLSVSQLKTLTDRMKALHQWDEAEEVAFEAEPGTLNEAKLTAIREIGVTANSAFKPGSGNVFVTTGGLLAGSLAGVGQTQLYLNPACKPTRSKVELASRRLVGGAVGQLQESAHAAP